MVIHLEVKVRVGRKAVTIEKMNSVNRFTHPSGEHETPVTAALSSTYFVLKGERHEIEEKDVSAASCRLFTSAHLDGALHRLPTRFLCARLRALNTP